MLNKMLFLLAICCASLLSAAHAQTGYEVGKIYSFTALNTAATKAVTLNVVFDKEGIATISRTEAAPTDKVHHQFAYLIDSDDWNFYPSDDEGLARLEVKTTKPENYFTISFDEPVAAKNSNTTGGVMISSVSCYCASSLPANVNAKCNILYMGGDKSGCVECQSEGQCPSCKILLPKPNSKSETTSILLIQAKEVRFATK